MTSFWGAPSYQPETPEVMRAIEQFHETGRRGGRDKAVRVAHVTLRAAVLFIASASPKDAMAALDDCRRLIAEGAN